MLLYFLILILNIRKKKEEKLTNVGLQSYYANLRVGERGKLIAYIISQLGMSYFTWYGKFVGKRQQFTAAELIALEPIINDELWRQ